MLKFIRKYQMIILVIGGSLLMVVFLLQPVLERLAPSPLKAKVASLDNGKVFTRGDIIRAQSAVTLLGRSNPRALQPMSMGGLGINGESERIAALHWLMFADMASRAGLVGEIEDGASWINEIAQTEAIIAAQGEVRNGQLPPAEYPQRVADLQMQIATMINRNANAAAANMNGSMEDVYRTLAEARGMYRLVNSVYATPSFSDVQAIDATKSIYDAVAVNAIVIDSNLIAGAIEDPSDEELSAFFEQYASSQRADNEFGIGYMMPTRIKLGWIALNKQDFMDAIQIDRVEIQKIWKRGKDDGSIVGDFAAERAGIERAYLDEQATSLMIEADRLIRAQVLAKTNNFNKVDGKTQLPDNWASLAPKLDEIATAVTERLNEQFGVSMPTLEVQLRGDRWFSANEIISLPGIGFSSYNVASRQIPFYSLPQFFDPEYDGSVGLDVQVNLPIVEQAATDGAGNRYYAMVIDVRQAGPADGIDDASREQVLQDYKSLQAYELLLARKDELAAIARDNDDLAPVLDQVMAMTQDTEATRPGVLRQILVRKDTIERGVVASTVNPRLNTESFRDAVIAAADGLDPLIEPSTLTQSPIVIAEPLPRSRSFAFAMVVAPRPLTLERFRANAAVSMRQTGSEELREAGFFDASPFSYESLSERYGLKILQEEDEN